MKHMHETIKPCTQSQSQSKQYSDAQNRSKMKIDENRHVTNRWVALSRRYHLTSNGSTIKKWLQKWNGTATSQTGRAKEKRMTMYTHSSSYTQSYSSLNPSSLRIALIVVLITGLYIDACCATLLFMSLSEQCNAMV
jgi:hypothetical protein